MASALLLALALGGISADGPPEPGDFAPSENIECRKDHRPEYPRRLQRAGVGGLVVVKVDVDDTGAVRGVSVYQASGNAELDTEAMRAALRWCYWPGREGDRTYGGGVLVPIKFTP